MTSMPIILMTRSSPSRWHDSIPGIHAAMPPKSPTTAHTSSAGRSMSISARALPIAPPSLGNAAACHGAGDGGPSGLQVEHAVGELLELLARTTGGDDRAGRTNLENPTSTNLSMSRRSPSTPSGTRSRMSAVPGVPARPAPDGGVPGRHALQELVGRVTAGVADADAEVLGVDAPPGVARRRPR